MGSEPSADETDPTRRTVLRSASAVGLGLGGLSTVGSVTADYIAPPGGGGGDDEDYPRVDGESYVSESYPVAHGGDLFKFVTAVDVGYHGGMDLSSGGETVYVHDFTATATFKSLKEVGDDEWTDDWDVGVHDTELVIDEAFMSVSVPDYSANLFDADSNDAYGVDPGPLFAPDTWAIEEFALEHVRDAVLSTHPAGRAALAIKEVSEVASGLTEEQNFDYDGEPTDIGNDNEVVFQVPYVTVGTNKPTSVTIAYNFWVDTGTSTCWGDGREIPIDVEADVDTSWATGDYKASISERFTLDNDDYVWNRDVDATCGDRR